MRIEETRSVPKTAPMGALLGATAPTTAPMGALLGAAEPKMVPVGAIWARPWKRLHSATRFD